MLLNLARQFAAGALAVGSFLHAETNGEDPTLLPDAPSATLQADAGAQ